MLDQSHLKVCYAAQPMLFESKLNPNDIYEESRKKAEYLGAKGISFFAGKWEERNKSLAYEQLLKTTRAICDYAAKKDMMIELEVFDFNVDKDALIGLAPYAAQFAADVRMSHNNFGLIVDLSHFQTTYET